MSPGCHDQIYSRIVMVVFDTCGLFRDSVRHDGAAATLRLGGTGPRGSGGSLTSSVQELRLSLVSDSWLPRGLRRARVRSSRRHGIEHQQFRDISSAIDAAIAPCQDPEAHVHLNQRSASSPHPIFRVSK